ncbi:type III pantothenate kinase [Helicobacter sp. MIT 99-5507]|uniref:type III pantothenate kinase n=1 Tax=Helicobacter sp. MIT 99-5507 TaxID=152489 RepID=UPI000E1EBC14|nr:type III pantothenate kinase [Helicobacter sp. MIT 99-5507]RDU57337.1 pantothenate kinase [Helicobacter sp. MIT 99-5507]
MFLCDIGNTYLHFFCRGKMWKEKATQITKKNHDIPIYYISVNKKNEKKLLESHPKCLNIENYINLDTIYKGLGIDRKAACLSIQNGVIVDAGSAITIDIMQSGIHLGGFILPGLDTYNKLFSNIEVLNLNFNLNVSLTSLPQNTRDAISCGCIKSIILMIQNAAKNDYIYFTGGDGRFLSKFFNQSIYDNTLVFKGMLKALQKNTEGLL